MESQEGQVYLTSEQLVRLAGLGLDALVGLQITSGTDPDSPALVDLVDIDNPSRSRHFIVDPDGTFEETT